MNATKCGLLCQVDGGPCSPDMLSGPNSMCSQEANEYMRCVRENDGRQWACKELSKAYLECRMRKGLTENQDLSPLGFGDGKQDNPDPAQSDAARRAAQEAQQRGYVAGVKRAGKEKW